TNVPCSENVAFDVERLTRSQPSTRGSAPTDPVDEGSLILESLRSSAISQLPHEGEITPRTGEINIAVTITILILAFHLGRSAQSCGVAPRKLLSSLFPLAFLGLGYVGLAAEIAVKSDSLPFPLSTEEWFIIASFGLLSALTLCYMIIKATASLYATE
ncbi:hypothetical protein AB205_0016760, partial [Aquarana catesbeiana]